MNHIFLRRWLAQTTALAGLLFCLGWATAYSKEGRPIDNNGAKPRVLLVHYMPWYMAQPVRGHWGMHWVGPHGEHNPESLGKDGLPDIWSNYHPLIGLYDSADPDAIECHFLQMKLAGIDGIVLDWYGIADAADYVSNQEASVEIFAAAEKFGLKFVACYEDRTIEFLVKEEGLPREQIGDQLSAAMRWLQDNWFDAPQYLRIDDRPLLLNFGPIFVDDPAVWQTALAPLTPKPLLFTLHHLRSSADADGGFTWVPPQVWEGNPSGQEIESRLWAEYRHSTSEPTDVIPSAFPGFHDVYNPGYPEVPHRDGQTLRESLGAAYAGDWPIVQLVTWNDYGEGTMLEPTHEFGYQFLEIIQEVRQQELGDQFSFTTDDLRLPAKLFALRKSQLAPQADLDRIAELLLQGETSAARAAMENIAAHAATDKN